MACAPCALRRLAGCAGDSLPPSRVPDEETLRSRECRDDWQKDAASSVLGRHPASRESRRCRESADPVASIDSTDASPSSLRRRMATVFVVHRLPGSARVPRVGFGASPKQSFEKVRDDEMSSVRAGLAVTRETRALPRPVTPCAALLPD